MPRFDHHIHTTRYSPDSDIDPEVLLLRAKEYGLDGIVITEHDEQWTQPELDDLSSRADGLVVLSGVEVSAREGHFLVYGLPDLSDVGPGIRLRELVKVVRSRGAAIVAAHPYRWGQDFDEILLDHGPVFDGLELVSNNVLSDMRPRIARAASKHKLGVTGSSDAHDDWVIGCYHTEFAGPIRTMADFVAAIRSGQGRPRHRIGAELTTGPVEVDD